MGVIFDYILRGIQYFISWISEKVSSLAPELEISLSVINGNVFDLRNVLSPDQWAFVNRWVPLDFLINLLTAYYAIKLSMWVWRWFCKWLPGF